MKTSRLWSETFTIPLKISSPDGEPRKPSVIDVSLAYRDGKLHELVFVGRGKIGSGIDLMFHDLGIQLSRAIQGRDPETGAPIG